MRTWMMSMGAVLVMMTGDTARADEPYGLSVSLGAGVAGFTGTDMRDASRDGGVWDVRLAFGTHDRIGFEAAYVGGAQAFRALDMSEDGVLVANAIEGDLRVNFPEGEIQPFLFIGVAAKRYDVRDAGVMGVGVGVHDTDYVFEWPVGAGFAIQNGPVVFDLRWSYRLATGAELLDAGDGHAPMHSWSATARIGYELP